MKKLKELLRILCVLFAAGFVFGCALYATIYTTWNVDLRISAIWGVCFVIIFWLGDYTKWVIKEKNALRKEEINKIQKELKMEISKLKNKIPRLIMSGGEGDITLASIYIDRVIELEKIKCMMENGTITHDYVDKLAKNNEYK